jgi:formiminoglutamate deiminase
MTDVETKSVARSGAVAGLCPITEANLGDGVFPAEDFLAAGGRVGIGSDSNVMIDVAEELRLLEYGQRLVHRGRNLLASREGASTGGEIYRAALRGGAQALGADDGALKIGSSADIVSLDTTHLSLTNRTGDALLDGWLFAARCGAVDCVWHHGAKVVTGGRHVAREQIVNRYRLTLAKVLG